MDHSPRDGRGSKIRPAESWKCRFKNTAIPPLALGGNGPNLQHWDVEVGAYHLGEEPLVLDAKLVVNMAYLESTKWHGGGVGHGDPWKQSHWGCPIAWMGAGKEGIR